MARKRKRTPVTETRALPRPLPRADGTREPETRPQDRGELSAEIERKLSEGNFIARIRKERRMTAALSSR